jgi:3-oxoacyl-[acyl-carrier protein] reductase
MGTLLVLIGELGTFEPFVKRWIEENRRFFASAAGITKPHATGGAIMIDLGGKVVLVTGGSRGIGAAIVRTLAHAGADIVLHYGQSRDAAEAIASELGEGRCTLVSADLADDAAPARLWAEAMAWKGRIDVLVNNAGIFIDAGVDDDFEQWSKVWARTLQVNLVSASHLCRDAVRHFRQRDGDGIIINIASRAAHRGDSPDHSHYAASKAGMIGLTKTFARAFATEGVTAFTVAPGFVRTEMAEEFFAVHGEEPVVSEIPLGEVAEPEDVANMVAFLASGMARQSTGQTFDVNGASYVR